MDLDKFTKPTSAFTTTPSSLQLDTRVFKPEVFTESQRLTLLFGVFTNSYMLSSLETCSELR